MTNHTQHIRGAVLLLAMVLTTALAAPSTTAQSAGPFFQPGDRVAMVGNTFVDRMRDHGYLETMLMARLPRHKLRFRNLGWSGDTPGSQARPYNFSPLENDLTNHQTTVILACFGMGEAFEGPAGLTTFEQDLTAYLTNLRSKAYSGQAPPRLALITPIACENHGAITPLHDTLRANQALYLASMKRVADELGVRLIDVFTPTARLADSGWSERMTINGIHLSDYGYWAVCRLIADELAPDIGTSIQAQATGASTAIDVAYERLPDPAPPAGAKAHPSLADRLPRVSVTGLAPGRYALTVGERTLATADHAAWQSGVALTDTPAQDRTRALLAAINEKNDDFFHRWRALNTVHIVGQRKSSPAGQALPGELLEMDKIIEGKEARLGAGAAPAPSQTWTL
ncbi:MAG: SGNH/GDSL hydrolase family protein, partial [Planctomycetota bacterium]